MTGFLLFLVGLGAGVYAALWITARKLRDVRQHAARQIHLAEQRVKFAENLVDVLTPDEHKPRLRRVK